MIPMKNAIDEWQCKRPYDGLVVVEAKSDGYYPLPIWGRSFIESHEMIWEDYPREWWINPLKKVVIANEDLYSLSEMVSDMKGELPYHQYVAAWLGDGDEVIAVQPLHESSVILDWIRKGKSKLIIDTADGKRITLTPKMGYIAIEKIRREIESNTLFAPSEIDIPICEIRQLAIDSRIW